MADKNRLLKIRSSLEKHVGRKVRFKTKVGRKNVIVQQGVIESIHPSVFIIKLNGFPQSNTTESRMSFSYTDVLTKEVEIQVYRQDVSV